ncbi:unnamed protein product [Cyprideis torosa]|uniref:Prolyl endopeptidase n=1 Tax=Cyprideis torosa TaxID=163714 RepID=A0A7R8ZNT4_9CRUS|nr:unnamed protein product [Cyprideis torosa]CAG0898771.1 unnamed protein product [Cyprideis torosa]
MSSEILYLKVEPTEDRFLSPIDHGTSQESPSYATQHDHYQHAGSRENRGSASGRLSAQRFASAVSAKKMRPPSLGSHHVMFSAKPKATAAESTRAESVSASASVFKANQVSEHQALPPVMRKCVGTQIYNRESQGVRPIINKFQSFWPRMKGSELRSYKVAPRHLNCHCHHKLLQKAKEMSLFYAGWEDHTDCPQCWQHFGVRRFPVVCGRVAVPENSGKHWTLMYPPLPEPRLKFIPPDPSMEYINAGRNSRASNTDSSLSMPSSDTSSISISTVNPEAHGTITEPSSRAIWLHKLQVIAQTSWSRFLTMITKPMNYKIVSGETTDSVGLTKNSMFIPKQRSTYPTTIRVRARKGKQLSSSDVSNESFDENFMRNEIPKDDWSVLPCISDTMFHENPCVPSLAHIGGSDPRVLPCYHDYYPQTAPIFQDQFNPFLSEYCPPMIYAVPYQHPLFFEYPTDSFIPPNVALVDGRHTLYEGFPFRHEGGGDQKRPHPSKELLTHRSPHRLKEVFTLKGPNPSKEILTPWGPQPSKEVLTLEGLHPSKELLTLEGPHPSNEQTNRIQRLSKERLPPRGSHPSKELQTRRSLNPSNEILAPTADSVEKPTGAMETSVRPKCVSVGVGDGILNVRQEDAMVQCGSRANQDIEHANEETAAAALDRDRKHIVRPTSPLTSSTDSEDSKNCKSNNSLPNPWDLLTNFDCTLASKTVDRKITAEEQLLKNELPYEHNNESDEPVLEASKGVSLTDVILREWTGLTLALQIETVEDLNKKYDGVYDYYHGVKVLDPYRWLEDADSDETKEFVRRQNSITTPYLMSCPERSLLNAELVKTAIPLDCSLYRVLLVMPCLSPNENQVYIGSLPDVIDRSIYVWPLIGKFEASYEFVTNMDTRLLFRTNKDAPNYRVIIIDLEKPSPSNWITLIHEHPRDVLDWVSPVAMDKMVCCYLQDVKIRELGTGNHIHTIHLGLGSITGFSGRHNQSEIFFAFTSFLVPGIIYKVDLAKDIWEPEVYREVKINSLKEDDYVAYQIFYESFDKTRIPMFLAHRKTLTLNGKNPTLIYGYGGFSVCSTPTFSVTRMVFMSHFNGIVAVPNLRGGGEYGELWHDAGRLKNKKNSFHDFIASAEFLIDSGHTNPSRIAVMGASNGGMLVAGATNMRPDLFGVVIAQVGVMDLLRFSNFTIGYAWASDFGDPQTNPSDFKNMYALSPLHNIQTPKNGQYPAVLLLTADHDDRVVPLHSFKFIAELQRQAISNPYQAKSKPVQPLQSIQNPTPSAGGFWCVSLAAPCVDSGAGTSKSKKSISPTDTTTPSFGPKETRKTKMAASVSIPPIIPAPRPNCVVLTRTEAGELLTEEVGAICNAPVDTSSSSGRESTSSSSSFRDTHRRRPRRFSSHEQRNRWLIETGIRGIKLPPARFVYRQWTMKDVIMDIQRKRRKRAYFAASASFSKIGCQKQKQTDASNRPSNERINSTGSGAASFENTYAGKVTIPKRFLNPAKGKIPPVRTLQTERTAPKYSLPEQKNVQNVAVTSPMPPRGGSVISVMSTGAVHAFSYYSQSFDSYSDYYESSDGKRNITTDQEAKTETLTAETSFCKCLRIQCRNWRRQGRSSQKRITIATRIRAGMDVQDDFDQGNRTPHYELQRPLEIDVRGPTKIQRLRCFSEIFDSPQSVEYMSNGLFENRTFSPRILPARNGETTPIAVEDLENSVESLLKLESAGGNVSLSPAFEVRSLEMSAVFSNEKTNEASGTSLKTNLGFFKRARLFSDAVVEGLQVVGRGFAYALNPTMNLGKQSKSIQTDGNTTPLTSKQPEQRLSSETQNTIEKDLRSGGTSRSNSRTKAAQEKQLLPSNKAGKKSTQEKELLPSNKAGKKSTQGISQNVDPQTPQLQAVSDSIDEPLRHVLYNEHFAVVHGLKMNIKMKKKPTQTFDHTGSILHGLHMPVFFSKEGFDKISEEGPRFRSPTKKSGKQGNQHFKEHGNKEKNEYRGGEKEERDIVGYNPFVLTVQRNKKQNRDLSYLNFSRLQMQFHKELNALEGMNVRDVHFDYFKKERHLNVHRKHAPSFVAEKNVESINTTLGLYETVSVRAERKAEAKAKKAARRKRRRRNTQY